MGEEQAEKLRKIVVEFLQAEEGNLTGALDLAVNFSTKNSIPSDFLLELSNSFMSKKSYELAYVFAKTAASSLTGSEKAVALFNAGNASYFLNLLMEAEEQYKLALEADPNDAITHSNYGILLSEMGKLKEAEKQYNLALEADPNDAITHSNYGNLLLKMGKLKEAEEQYKLALEADPNDANTYYNYGNLLKQMGKLEETEEQYKLAIEADPKHVSAHSNYGILLKQMGRLQEAEEQYKLAIEENPNDANIHSNYGLLLSEIGKLKEAEEQYKLAIEANPNDANIHSNYGLFLSEIGKLKEAEEQYKLAIEESPKHVNTHYNYGLLLSEIGKLKEAEEQYKLAIEESPKHVSAHSNYGNLLKQMGRLQEAEEQYKLAIEESPKHVSTHSNYGLLLSEIGKLKEAEEQFKTAIELDPREPNSHGAYGFLLLLEKLESNAIEETKIASRLFREKGNNLKEHLSLAWLYEELTNKYYNLKDYQKSGEYAEISGDEYIKVGKQAGEKFKGTSLTKGYTLKGRAKIRKLGIKAPFYKDLFKRIWNRESYDVEKFTKIIDCIMDASQYYEKAARASPKENQLCNACSISMSCLSEMLDYMLAVIKQEKTPQLEEKLKKWNEKMEVAKNVYKENSKGEIFIESLYKLIGCIQNLDKYKKHGTREYGRAFEECYKELIEIANNIEGPLQKIIEDSAKQMDICRLKIMPYAGTETGYTPQPSKLQQFSKWILNPKRIIGAACIILTFIGKVIVDHYNEDIFSLIQEFGSILFSYLR